MMNVRTYRFTGKYHYIIFYFIATLLLNFIISKKGIILESEKKFIFVTFK